MVANPPFLPSFYWVVSDFGIIGIFGGKINIEFLSPFFDLELLTLST